MYKNKNLNLTEGTIWKTLIIFTLPILAGNFFQHLYTVADAVIVGKFTGKEGLAAIDSVYSLLYLPVNFFTGLSTGAAIVISQFFGAKKPEALSKTIHTTIALTLIFGITLSIIGVLLAPALLFIMGVPKDIYHMTLSYIRIYFGGMAVSLLYNIGAGILRAMGNSKMPFYALVFSSVLNVVLDLIFIGILNWGIGGAAFATVLSQFLSSIIIFFSLINKKSYSPVHILKIQIEKRYALNIVRLGTPVGLQAALFPIANMIIQARINSTGTDNIAAWALCGKLDFLIWISMSAMTSAVSTFAAQNYGANKIERIHKVTRIGLMITIILIGAISTALYFFNIPIGKLFINAKDFGVLIIMERLMHILAPFYTVFVFAEILSVVMNGTGETLKPMILTLIGTCFTRIVWVFFIIPPQASVDVIIRIFPISWTLTSTIFIGFYYIYQRKKL